MMKGQKGIFLRIGITVFLIFFACVTDLNPLTSMILYAAAYFIIGHDILREAAERIKDGDGLDECVLMVPGDWLSMKTTGIRKPWRSCSFTKSANGFRATP